MTQKVCTLRLERVNTSPMATQGLLIDVDNTVLCHTIENKWEDNKPYVSCIPTGCYKLAFRNVGGFYNRYLKKKWAEDIGQDRGMIHMLDVPGRTYCLWHIGNFHKNTEGCVLLNTKSLKGDDGEWQGRSSLAAYKKVYVIVADLIQHHEVWVNIKNAW